MNLLLVIHEYANQHLILPAVLEEFKKIGNEKGWIYRARLVHDWKPNWKHKLWSLGQPTVVVSMEPILKFKPEWATIWTQVPCDKAWECEQLERAGLPAPKWRAIQEGKTPDLSGFDDFVVTKPARSACGALVGIMRRNRVRWRPSEISKFKWQSNVVLVQEYIHTGPWPISYRVGQIFGEPIYAWRCVADRSRKSFDGTKRNSHFFAGRTIVSSGKGCTFDMKVPNDVFELARLTHEAFPTVPILGVDIIRDHDSGRLYVIEANSMGDTFHLTSDTGRKISRESNFDWTAQFGGARAIARGIYNRMREFEACLNDESDRNVESDLKIEEALVQ